jgi:hypothetical protein
MSDAPERIWITQTSYGWTLEEPGGNWATEEYVRADLVPAQPSQEAHAAALEDARFKADYWKRMHDEVRAAIITAQPSQPQQAGDEDCGKAGDQGDDAMDALQMLARLRSEGWRVAVHNDYRQHGQDCTFWLLTHPTGRWVKGEGVSDGLALDQAMNEAHRQPQQAGVTEAATYVEWAAVALEWAVHRWNAEVANRPLSNAHRRTLDDTWRQAMRQFGGDPDTLVGPSHDALTAALSAQQGDA